MTIKIFHDEEKICLALLEFPQYNVFVDRGKWYERLMAWIMSQFGSRKMKAQFEKMRWKGGTMQLLEDIHEGLVVDILPKVN